MAFGLTPRLARVKTYIAERIKVDGVGPTLREIARDCKVGSGANAQAIVNRLAALGHVRRLPGRKGALEVAEGPPLRPEVVAMAARVFKDVLLIRVNLGEVVPAPTVAEMQEAVRVAWLGG